MWKTSLLIACSLVACKKKESESKTETASTATKPAEPKTDKPATPAPAGCAAGFTQAQNVCLNLGPEGKLSAPRDVATGKAYDFTMKGATGGLSIWPPGDPETVDDRINQVYAGIKDKGDVPGGKWIYYELADQPQFKLAMLAKSGTLLQCDVAIETGVKDEAVKKAAFDACKTLVAQ